MKPSHNIDEKVVRDFGREWKRFDQSKLSTEELSRLFENYFAIFPWDHLPDGAQGFDLGCGSGRWARMVAPRVGMLHCIDPSKDALDVARANLDGLSNCRFHLAGVDEIPLDDGTMDFGYSLGVLHHVPDTVNGIRNCVRKLKPGAPFLIYLYYAFDNRPMWFRAVWKASDLARRFISGLPFQLKNLCTQFIAATVYFPMAKAAAFLDALGFDVSSFPLSAYRDKSFYTMRTDALDRFGTRLEKRFTKAEIKTMLEACGLEYIRFSEESPYWTSLGFRRDA